MNARSRIRMIVVYSLSLLLLTLLQTATGDLLSWRGVRPDLTLVLAVISGYLFGVRDGYWVGLTAGAMRDFLTGRNIGLGMLLLMLSGVGAGYLLQGLLRRRPIYAPLAVLAATVPVQLAAAVAAYALPLLPGIPVSLGASLHPVFQRLPRQLLLNAAAAVMLTTAFSWFGPYSRQRRLELAEHEKSGERLWA